MSYSNKLILGMLVFSLILLLGCTGPTVTPQDNAIDKTPTVTDNEQDSGVIEEIVENISEEQAPINVKGSGITYQFNSIECPSTSNRLDCESCVLDKNMKISNVYVDYTNATSAVQGYILKMNYGSDNNVVFGDPVSMSVGQTKRLTVSTNPLTLNGCISEAKIEIYTYLTNNLVGTLIVESDE